jgi:hypothetical protein
MSDQYLNDRKLLVKENGEFWFECGTGCKFSFKSIQIGDWDMDTDATKSVAHGQTLSKILNVSCLVVNDAGDKKYQAIGHDGGTIPLEIQEIDATNVVLARKAGGTFDSTDFDSTSYNRGFITILITE